MSVRQLSDLDIVLRLSGEHLLTGIGYTGAKGHLREFAARVRSRIPELRGLSDEEVEEKVLSALEHIIVTHCEKLKNTILVTTGGAEYAAELYACKAPGAAFYIVKSEYSYPDAAVYRVFYAVSRGYEEAKKEYNDEASHIAEEYDELKLHAEETGEDISSYVDYYEYEPA